MNPLLPSSGIFTGAESFAYDSGAKPEPSGPSRADESVQSFGELREGMTVGFDMSWTSGGLRVSVIKAFPVEEVASGAAPSNESVPAAQSQAGEDLDQD